VVCSSVVDVALQVGRWRWRICETSAAVRTWWVCRIAMSAAVCDCTGSVCWSQCSRLRQRTLQAICSCS
jgi:hypothetical protein